MKKVLTSLLAVLMAVLMSASFSSCSKDDDLDDSSYYDFSIIWKVTDKGDLTTAIARQLESELNDEFEDVFEDYTTREAKKDFDKLCEYLEDDLEEMGFECTLKATLYRENDRKDIASHTFHIR